MDTYIWDKWLEPSHWDKILHQNDDILYKDFQEAAKEWSEKQNFKNQSIGEARAVQELAFREKLTSEKSEKIGKSEKFYWITINPKPGTSLPELIKVQQKIIKKKWITSYAYVYETTENNHIHSHTLIRADYEAARARKEIANTAKQICDVSNVAIYKFVILNEDQAREKIHYMLGKKKVKKLHNVKLIEEWRKKENLKQIYSSEVPLSCWDLGTGTDENLEIELVEPDL